MHASAALKVLSATGVIQQCYGTWKHSAGGEILVAPGGDSSKVLINHYLLGSQLIAISDFVTQGGQLSFCKHVGTLEGNMIRWSNGSVWTKIQRLP